MAKFPWNEITREDVLQAIQIFNSEHPVHPAARSTYLILNGKRYPAKHIRGMAYEVHFGREAHKSDYTGGQETVRFFERLGFEVYYVHQNINTHPIKESPPVIIGKQSVKETPPSISPPIHEASNDSAKISVPSKGVIEQKNALQLLLNKLFDGDVVCEKTFPWMKTPQELSGPYTQLYNALSAYRGNRTFAKKNVKLRCDFVCEGQKLIIEYDERQHFSEARRISLLSYPQIPLNYDRDLWVQTCQNTQAKDSKPVNRDEVRAFYDSVRDIEAAAHGYCLLRIMHGQIDFTSASAREKLIELLHTEKAPSKTLSPLGERPAVTSSNSLKVGLYLQTYELHGNLLAFKRAMALVKNSDIDILVFPEISYFPFVNEYTQADFLNANNVQQLYDKALDLSREIGCAVVISNEDKYGTIMCIYANAFAAEGETLYKDYIKHTMTEYSACDIGNYQEYAQEAFQPILYKGFRIGMTICYDCNYSIFSRKYAKNGADIILNCTGGNVVYGKWFKYNKVRAIENNCFTFVTMAGEGSGRNPHNYVFGFTPSGKEMTPKLLNGPDSGRRNFSGGIYVYDTAEYDGSSEADPSLHQSESVNKTADFYIPIDKIVEVAQQGRGLTDNLSVLNYQGCNIVFCLVENEDILEPEKVLRLLYAQQLKGVPNMRYIIINHWNRIDSDFYAEKLSVVLKVRAMENYCAVLLTSDNLTKCFQCGQNRTAQVVKAVDGQFGLDLQRTGGPETIWRDKAGMRARWRDNIEWLIQSL